MLLSFCGPRIDLLESLVSSNVNMTMKDFQFSKQQPHILKLSSISQRWYDNACDSLPSHTMPNTQEQLTSLHTT